MADVAALCRREDELAVGIGTAKAVWQDLGDYLAPRRANIIKETTPGAKQTERLFESSGAYAAQTLAASLAGTLTSPTQKWFSLKARRAEINRLKGVRDWLEETADRAYLALNQSNFTAESNEVYFDLAVFGTGCIFQEEGPQPAPNVFGGLRFEAYPIGSYLIAEDPYGVVDTVFRPGFDMTARQIIARFGEKAFRGTELARQAGENLDKVFKVHHAVYPRDDYRRGSTRGQDRAWASCYYLRQPQQLLAEGGFYEFPFAVPRWTKTTGEMFGRSPGHTALPDVASLNRATELYLAAAAKAIEPSLFVLEDSIIGTLSLEPAAVNVGTREGAIEIVESKARFDVAEALHERLERKIREIYYVHQLELKESPAMTATEVIQRQEEKLRLLGPTAGRLHTEFLSRIIERTIALLLRAGVLTQPPEELLQGDAEIDIEYEGPLARAQKAVDLVAIERKNAYLANLIAMNPEAGTKVAQNTDWDAEYRLVNELTGVPGNILLGAEQVAEIREGMARQQQAMAKMQMLGGVAEAVGKAAPALKLLQGGKAPEEAAA